jgi:hypothetical protein
MGRRTGDNSGVVSDAPKAALRCRPARTVCAAILRLNEEQRVREEDHYIYSSFVSLYFFIRYNSVTGEG